MSLSPYEEQQEDEIEREDVYEFDYEYEYEDDNDDEEEEEDEENGDINSSSSQSRRKSASSNIQNQQNYAIQKNMFNVFLSDLPMNTTHSVELLNIFVCMKSMVQDSSYPISYIWQYDDMLAYRTAILDISHPSNVSEVFTFRILFPTPSSDLARKIFPESPPTIHLLTRVPAIHYLAIAHHPLLSSSSWNPCQHMHLLLQSVVDWLKHDNVYCDANDDQSSVSQEIYDPYLASARPPSTWAIELLISVLTGLYFHQLKSLSHDLADALDALVMVGNGCFLKPCAASSVRSQSDLKKKYSGTGYSRGNEAACARQESKIRTYISALFDKICSLNQSNGTEAADYHSNYKRWILVSPLLEIILCLLNECSREEVDREKEYIEQLFTITFCVERFFHCSSLDAAEKYSDQRREAIEMMLEELYSRLSRFEADNLVDGEMPWFSNIKQSSEIFAKILENMEASSSNRRVRISRKHCRDEEDEVEIESDVQSALHQRVAFLSSDQDSGKPYSNYFFRTSIAAMNGIKAPSEAGSINYVKCSPKWSRELRFIGENLPEEINLFLWEDHPNYFTASMRILNRDSPYYGGVFFFDICVPEQYPTLCPSVQFMTTGEGTVRFNPNLYNCGKVCLSLLGTWAGEPWNPKTSNMTQVLKSILYLIFTEEPFYNEPGYNPEVESLRQNSFEYNLKVFKDTIHWAIDYHLHRLKSYPQAIQQMLIEYYESNWDKMICPVLEEKVTVGIYEHNDMEDVKTTLRAVSEKVRQLRAKQT
eukprot:gene4311-4732_t